MSRRTVGIVVATALTCLLFATVTTSGGVNLWGEPQWEPPELTVQPIEIDLEVGDEAFAEENATDRSTFELPRWIRAILTALVTTALVIGFIALLVAGWNRRPRLRWKRRASGGDFDVLPDVAAVVVEEAAAQRAALLDGAPRNAIVHCWLRLEHDVQAAGLRRPPADTSAEFTERVLGQYSVDTQAIRELSALYREARFSEHPLDESARHAALDALDRLHRSLTEQTNSAARTSAAAAEDPA
ncbi:MAG: DUF4129 domain-containing protein [Ilumatobacter sp.]